MTETSRTRNYRPLILLLALVVIVLLLIVIFLLERPCDCQTVVTTPGGEEVVAGSTGPKDGDLTTPDPSLPTKGEDVPPIGGSAGDKPDAGTVKPGDPQDLVDRYGDQAKPETGDIPGVVEEGQPKQMPSPTPSDVSYGRIRFTITAAGVLRPEKLMTIDGNIQPPSVITGDLLVVTYLDDKPIFYETINDPLVSIGFPQADEGHSYGTQTEGTILLSLPPSLMGENRPLANARIEVYRLGPFIPSDTPLTADTLPSLIQQSTLFSSISGDEILRALDQVGGIG